MLPVLKILTLKLIMITRENLKKSLTKWRSGQDLNALLLQAISAENKEFIELLIRYHKDTVSISLELFYEILNLKISDQKKIILKFFVRKQRCNM